MHNETQWMILRQIVEARRDDMPSLPVFDRDIYAPYAAEAKFAGRDWRRIKREIRKASLLARKKLRATPPAVQMWHNTTHQVV